MSRHDRFSSPRDFLRAPIDWPLWAQYLLAIVIGLLALVGRLALAPALGDRVPFILAFAALMVLIVLVRPGPFLVGATVGGVGTWFAIVPSGPTFGFSAPLDLVQVALFVLAVTVATAAAWLSSRSQRRLHLSLRIAEQQREALRVTLASIGDAVITTDGQGHITFVNAVAESLTGWTDAEASGRPLDQVFETVDEVTRKPLLSPVQRVVRAGRSMPLDPHALLIGRDRSERPIDDSAAPIRDADGATVGVVLVFRDITERRHAERALREADLRKDEFIATLAHELRNPLAPISSALSMLDRAPDDRALLGRLHRVIERQLGHLVRLVDDLLDISRITRDRLELRMSRVALADVLQQAIETCRPMMEAGQHQLEIQLPTEPVPLHADAVRLSQVFSNLLGNAFKYTAPGGRVLITARVHDSQVEVTVSDNGIGFPPHMKDEIFGMFTQLDRSSSSGGLGIGLTLVRRLVEKHAGTVRAFSEGPGQGSRFTVALPIPQPTAVPAAARAGRLQQASEPRRVLVVDDNRDACDTLVTLLQMCGHEVCGAYDGSEALAAAERFQPDLVLLDIGLPRMNGYDVARTLRAAPWGQDMTLVAVTGWGQQEDRERSAAAGFDRHLTKPVDEQGLAALLADPPRIKT